jgi:hypothetical protein
MSFAAILSFAGIVLLKLVIICIFAIPSGFGLSIGFTGGKTLIDKFRQHKALKSCGPKSKELIDEMIGAANEATH